MIFGSGLFLCVLSLLWLCLLAAIDNGKNRKFGWAVNKPTDRFILAFAVGLAGFVVGLLMMVMSLGVAAAEYLP